MADAQLADVAPYVRGSAPARASSWRRRVVLTVPLLALLALEYVAFVGTLEGRRIDTRAILDARTGRSWAFDRPPVTSDLGHILAATSFALLAAGILALGLRRRQAGHALGALAVVAAAALTAHLLKSVIGDADLLGGATERRIGASFPSGHATVAMSLGLALVRTVPVRWGPVAALGAVMYACSVGVAIILLSWHYPSDVAGGYLIAAAWHAAASPVPRASGRAAPAPASRVAAAARRAAGAAAAMALGVAAASGLVLPVFAVTHNAPARPLPVGLAAGVATLAVCACVAALTALTARGRALRLR